MRSAESPHLSDAGAGSSVQGSSDPFNKTSASLRRLCRGTLSLDEGFERWRDRLSLVPLPLRKALQQTYQGISPSLTQQLAGQLTETPVQELLSESWEALHQNWQFWLQALQSEQHQQLTLESDNVTDSGITIPTLSRSHLQYGRTIWRCSSASGTQADRTARTGADLR